MNCKYELIYSVNGTEKTLTAPSNVDVKLAFSDEDGRRRVVLTALTDVELNSYNETEHDFFTKPEPVDPDPKGDLYFINGYQSWTETREFYADARERNVTSLPKALVKNFSLDRYGDATFYEYDKRILHGYDYFYVKGTTGAFICNLNARNAYLIVEVVRRIGAVTLISDVRGKHLKAGETYTICDYMYRGTYEEGLVFCVCLDFRNLFLHFCNQHLELFLALLPRGSVDVLCDSFPVHARGEPALIEVVVYHRHATRTGLLCLQ